MVIKQETAYQTLIDGYRYHNTAEETANNFAEYFAAQSQKLILPDNYEPLIILEFHNLLVNIAVREEGCSELHK